MKLLTSRKSFSLIGGLIVLALLLVSACGKKGDPAMIAAGPPSSPSGLIVEKTKDGKGIIASWPLGEGKSPSLMYKLERSGLDVKGSECPGCPRTFAVIAEIGANQEACKHKGGTLCRYRDVNVVHGYNYSYRLLSCINTERCETLSPPAEIVY
ncbi:MAG: hypothetical protein CSYNP_01403 [Syntrophus sp. SKADARSKE-3]|nr:hypothetical protein [Syntrophus sp. SKADARSKE-3]